MNELQALFERLVGYSIAWEDTAAWVQAVGAIIAVTFTAQQVSSLARVERERRAAPLELCCVGARQALLRYESFRDAMSGAEDVPGLARSALEIGLAKQMKGPFDDVRLSDMPTPKAIDALIEARILVDWFIMRVQAAADAKPGWDDGSATNRASMLILWQQFDLEKRRILCPLRARLREWVKAMRRKTTLGQ